jgi:hypothetical protein
MTLKNQSQTWIDIYAIQEPQNPSGGFGRVLVWQEYVQVAWFPRASYDDEEYHQQRRRRKVVLRTDDPTIFALLPENLSVVVYQGVPYEVKSTRNVANMGNVFRADLIEMISGETIPGPPIGGGIKCGGSAGVS